MVKNPLAWIDKNAHKVDTIIFHIESYHKFSKIQDTIKLIKEKHKKVGIALNPLTSVKSIQHLVKNINLVSCNFLLLVSINDAVKIIKHIFASSDV